MGNNIAFLAMLLAAVPRIGLAQAAKAPEEIARQTVVRLVDGKYDELYQSFSPDLRAALPVEALKSGVGPQVNALGKLLGTRRPAPSSKSAATPFLRRVPAKFLHLSIDFTISVDGNDQVSGPYMEDRRGARSDWPETAHQRPRPRSASAR